MNMKRGQIAETYVVTCHHCRAHETLFMAQSRSEAANLAKQAGWVRTRAFGWLCEDCDQGRVPADAARKESEAP